ncbi:FtsX-like permease family protein [Clostridium sporogenes]|uniref:ABC transporter permease n=1 Tax=Clostridium TaxID=1485 RepID=UPI000DFD0661|nr:FtsX-like permease family protein [Clostridium sporogenes]STC73626.1 putative ABC transporter permease [Clostridium botulinum]MCW6060112.1 FtsX-like permease family protein [Clostridium sporogenes]MCW6067792.1 FtsX-like permease family protein [Clostridium sporogenes]MDS1008148.1 FtsX-like permease family protein [Clostridium sporogenes]NFQ04082.1 ABC transporter permease [Clostridium sporogenes]
MKLFFKIAFNSIKKNKIRYMLLTCTLVLSTIIMLSTSIIKDSAIKIREDQLRKTTLNSQLVITTADEKDPFFNPKDIINFIKDIDGISHIVPRIGGMAKDAKTLKDINIIGVDLNKQKAAFPIELIDKYKVKDKENQIIINEKYAKENSLKVGAKIKLLIGTKNKEFIISGISKNTGVFDPSMNTAMISIDNAQYLLDQKDNAYSIGITIKNLDDINNMIEKIKPKVSSKFIIQQRYDMDYFKSYVGTIDMALKIIGVLSIFITLFLTYSTFSLIIYERLHQIGILRSLGISKKDIKVSVIVENLLIVLSSIVIGSILTIPFVRLILNYIVQDGYFTLDFRKFLFIDLIIVIFSVLVILVSLRKILNMSVINLLKGIGKTYYTNKIGKIFKFSFGVVLLIVSIVILISEYKRENGTLALILGALFFIISFVFLAKLLLIMFNWIYQKIFSIFKGSVSILFKELVMQFSNIVDIVIITSIIICSIYVSVTLKNMINNGVMNVYGNADLMLSIDGSVEEDFTDKIKNIKYIKNSLLQSRTTEVIKDTKVDIAGIDGFQYKKDFSTEIIKKGKNNIFDKLDDGKNIIITTTFSKNTGVNLNDSLKINEVNYKVVGVVSSFENMGKVLFLSKDNFNKDIKVKDKDLCLIKVNNNQIKSTTKEIEKLFKDKYENKYSIQELTVLNEENNNNNKKTFTIVNVLICISTIICIISMSNNVTINLLSRKKVYATKGALGISKGYLSKCILFEAIILGSYSGIFGLGLGVTLSNYINKILSYYIGDMVFIKYYKIMVILVLISIGITVISYIYPMRKIYRINIIDEIKSDE